MIPLQVVRDVNALVKVSYWSTRRALVHYLKRVNSMTNNNGKIFLDEEDTSSSLAQSISNPTIIFDSFYTPVVKHAPAAH
jgi:hypothetical protein